MHVEPLNPEALRRMAENFDIGGRVVATEPHGTGHIHDTYALTCENGGAPRRYVLQRVNHNVFRDIPRLMENICRVTAHLRGKIAQRAGGDPQREALAVIPTRAGTAYHATEKLEYWRVFLFIDRARTFDRLQHPRQAREAARAYGTFQSLLSDLPAPPLHETIPFFHDTPKRFAAFQAAVAADAMNRAKACRAEIDFALTREGLTGAIVEALARGDLPTRVTHNDTKLNNVMLDADTGAAVCVIDLDTVMPGSSLYDFGDQVRSMAGGFEENERDLRHATVNLEIYRNLVDGYLDAAHDFLTEDEVRLLTFSGRLISLEVGLRFLADYLQGDTYFKTSRPGENLDRARTQFALVRAIETDTAHMDDIVGESWSRLR